MKDRKKIEKYILDYLKDIDLSGDNIKIYQDLFKRLSDREFLDWLKELKETGNVLPVFSPNDGKKRFDTKNNLKVGKKRGVKFFQRVWLSDEDGNKYLTNHEVLILHMPMKRQAQTLVKGIRYAKHNLSKDVLTGQPAGDSRAVGLSYPETNILNDLGLKNSLRELLVTRGGGDTGANSAMYAYIEKYGKVRNKDALQYSTGTTTTNTLKAFLKGALIRLDNKNI